MHPLWRGTLAQLVEQRTENPCVPGSIPGGTTKKSRNILFTGFFVFWGANSYILRRQLHRFLPYSSSRIKITSSGIDKNNTQPVLVATLCLPVGGVYK